MLLPALSIPLAEPATTLGGSPADDDVLLEGLRSAVLQRGARSVGSTSLVLKVHLDGGLDAAFKPETRSHPGRWRAEVAAYRLARALGLDNVLPSTPRAVKWPSLLASAREGGALEKLVTQAVPAIDDREATLSGAMIVWRKGLTRLPLEHDPLWTAWGEWLSQSPPARPLERRLPAPRAAEITARAPLAPQISSLVLFDHLTGNRDRWSGHNVLTDMTGSRLVFLDNNLAFEPRLDEVATRRRAHVLLRVEKFSRSLVAAVRRLSESDLPRIFGTDDRGLPLLDAASLASVMSRRAELLAHVDALIARHGEARVLAYD